MEWVGEAKDSRGVSEREFRVSCEGRLVPGLFWTPATPPKALVLLGHGGSNHKRTDYVLAIARRLVREVGFAAMAIDGPVHGARRSDSAEGDTVQHELGKLWQERPAVGGEMIADWQAALDAVLAIDGLSDMQVGYWGLSMGTLFGLPLVANEPRIAAATLGLMGSGEQGRLADAARKMRCPVTFFVQWDDRLIPREGALRLFDLLGSRHKRLRASPGGHADVPTAEFRAGVSFLIEQLGLRTGRIIHLDV